MKIQVLCDNHFVQYQIPASQNNKGIARILHPAHTLKNSEMEDMVYPESNLEGVPALVQVVFNAMKTVPTTSEHRMISFDRNTATIKVDGQVLTPDSDVSGFNQEVQTFFSTVYQFDNGRFAEIYRLSQLEDRQETVPKTMEKETIEIVNGKAVRRIVTEEIEEPAFNEFPMVDEAGNPVMSKPVKIGEDVDGNPVMSEPVQLIHKEPKMNRVSQIDKDRLKLLRRKTL